MHPSAQWRHRKNPELLESSYYPDDGIDVSNKNDARARQMQSKHDAFESNFVSLVDSIKLYAYQLVEFDYRGANESVNQIIKYLERLDRRVQTNDIEANLNYIIDMLSVSEHGINESVYGESVVGFLKNLGSTDLSGPVDDSQSRIRQWSFFDYQPLVDALRDFTDSIIEKRMLGRSLHDFSITLRTFGGSKHERLTAEVDRLFRHLIDNIELS